MRHTVMLVDDHPLFRSALRNLLEPHFDVVAEAAEGGEAVDKALMYRPDVVLMDMGMPGMDGVSATRAIKEKLPNTGIVVISASDQDECLFGAIEAGVSGYITKDDTPEHILDAVQHAAEGKAYLPPLIAKRVLGGISGANGRRDLGRSNGSTPLTSRELMVLRLMAEGKRNRDIAEALCISERTVGNHVTSIYDKLAIYDRAQAIVYAIKKGVVRV